MAPLPLEDDPALLLSVDGVLLPPLLLPSGEDPVVLPPEAAEVLPLDEDPVTLPPVAVEVPPLLDPPPA